MNTNSINQLVKVSLLLALFYLIPTIATYAQGYGSYGNGGSYSPPSGYSNGQPYGYNQGYGNNNGYGPNVNPNYPYGNQYGQYPPNPYPTRPPVVVVPVPPVVVPAPPVVVAPPAVIVQSPRYYVPYRQPWGRVNYGYRSRRGYGRRW
jgi:hypothetical protein